MAPVVLLPVPPVRVDDPYYLEKAQEFLISLYDGDGYYMPDADDGWQGILRRVTSEHGDTYETSSIFGEYYLLETMVRNYGTVHGAVASALLGSQTSSLTMWPATDQGSGELQNRTLGSGTGRRRTRKLPLRRNYR